MRSLRCFVALFLIALMSACASTPAPRHGGAPGGPDRHGRHDSGDARFASLRLCDGVKISNAPATDRYGQIINFDSTAYVGGASLLRAPVKACVSSGFGPRNGGASSFHHGVDLYTGRPAAIYASGDGVVESVATLRGYGNTILIRHAGGVKTRYAHLSDYAQGMRPGVRVAKGQYIGATGRTGNATAVHLHYEIIVDGKRHNPLTVGR